MNDRLPKTRKNLAGTYRPSRDRFDPADALKEAPEPPVGLCEGAAAHWNELAPTLVALRLLSRADLPMLGLLCRTLETEAALQKVIDEEGWTLATGTGSAKCHPAVTSLEKARNQAHKLLREFGLSPSARRFVERAPEPQKPSGFVRL